MSNKEKIVKVLMLLNSGKTLYYQGFKINFQNYEYVITYIDGGEQIVLKEAKDLREFFIQNNVELEKIYMFL